MPAQIISQIAGMASMVRQRLFSLPSASKRAVALLFDLFAAIVTVRLAILFSTDLFFDFRERIWYLYLFSPAVMAAVFAWTGIYRAVLRYSGSRTFVRMSAAGLLYGMAFLPIVRLLDIPGLPRSFAFMQPMMLLMMTGGSRALLRLWDDGYSRAGKSRDVASRIIVYGAGKAGTEIAGVLQQHRRFDVTGYFDDDPGLHGRTIDGLPVFEPSNAESIIRELGVTSVLIAMPSASRSCRNRIARKFQEYPVSIKTLPGIDEIADGKVTISNIREIGIEELLGREEVPVDHELIEQSLGGRVIAVTGAGGSIGSELCRQLISARPSKILLIDNTEFNLYRIYGELETRILRSGAAIRILPFLCDVSEPLRIDEICRVFKPSVIYHAAAYKHVPMVEYNPVEGVRNNVFGTLNIVLAALRYEVGKVVLISTDKAVRPTNVMGASKRFCELLFQAYAATGGHSTCFSIVRFGNVLGSSGSVVPLFRQQIKAGGPLTITHEEVCRYFMTIPEAAMLVVQAGAMGHGGEVFLLDMGEPVRIADLARRMVELSGLTVKDVAHPEGDIEIRITGLRPGEKLYEELLIGDHAEPTTHQRIFKAREAFTGLDELTGHLATMSQAIRMNDIGGLQQLLAVVIGGYHPEGTTADLFLMEEGCCSVSGKQANVLSKPNSLQSADSEPLRPGMMHTQQNGDVPCGDALPSEAGTKKQRGTAAANGHEKLFPRWA